ncbi:MAG: mycothiol system anti-sigma-R factor [Actinomycetota bacterium]
MSCGDPNDPECGEVLGRIDEFVDHELADDLCGKIRQHLAECGPCLSEYDRDLALKDLVRRTCGGDVAPQELRQRIVAHLTELCGQPPQSSAPQHLSTSALKAPRCQVAPGHTENLTA